MATTPPEAMLVWVVHAADAMKPGTHVELCDWCCSLMPCWYPRALLPLGPCCYEGPEALL